MQAERERRHLPHFGIGVGEQRHERRHAFSEADAADRQRGAAADARLAVGEQPHRSGGGGGGGGAAAAGAPARTGAGGAGGGPAAPDRADTR